MRHYLNLRILYSLFTEFRTVGPYELDWAGGQFKCWISQLISGTLLSCLQALNLFWLFFIIRIAFRFIWVGEAKDDRSDDEESEVEAEDEVAGSEKTPLLQANGAAASNGHAMNGNATNGRAANGTTKTNGVVSK